MESRSRELEELLAHGSWVRALARSLVHDSSRAEDLAQRGWLAALERGPGTARSLRQWFAGVLRNLAREDRRGDARRAARERQVAAPRGGAPADELCAALEISRRLAAAVQQLDEPYRSAIFRRYYEGLAPRRIAELEGLPLKTVKTRLARGLEKLRERLDREQRDDWVAACAPLLRNSKTAWVLGGIAMNVKLAILAAGLVLIGAWAVFHGRAGDLPELPVQPEGPSAMVAAGLESSASVSGGTRSSAIPSAGAASLGATAVCPYPHALPLLAGRVVDPHGVALAGVRLFLVPQEQALEWRRTVAPAASRTALATSDEHGRFSLNPRIGASILLGERAGWITLFACDTWSTDGSKELLVVMGPPVDIAGVVVDEHEQPVAGAELRVIAGEELRAALGMPSDTAVEVPWIALSDAQGRFALDAVPGLAQASLRASHVRHAQATLPLPERSRSDLRVVLRSREARTLAGEVVERNGAPVPGALVGMGRVVTRCDAEGRFELEPTGGALGAAAPGRMPVRLLEPETGWPARVTLVLGAEPLEIRGHLLDAQGKPQAGIEIRPVNEHLAGMLSSGVGEYSFPRTFEGLARRSDELETPACSDGNGAFVLRGLLDEEYVLRASDPRSLRQALSAPIRAGSQAVELRLPGSGESERVAGRALSLAGEPLAGVMLVPSRPALGGGLTRWPATLQGEPRRTGADGRFDFGEIATEGLEFQVMGEGLQTLIGWKPPQGTKLAEIELRIPRRCRMQVDLGDRPGRADSVVVLDPSGRELELWIEVRNVSSFDFAQPLREGRSGVLLVAENAALVILKKDGVEVERTPLQLKPGELETVRF